MINTEKGFLGLQTLKLKFLNLYCRLSIIKLLRKKYVDDEIAKIQPISTSNFVKKDGVIPMAGNLYLGNNKITNLANPINALDAANKQYVEAGPTCDE